VTKFRTKILGVVDFIIGLEITWWKLGRAIIKWDVKCRAQAWREHKLYAGLSFSRNILTLYLKPEQKLTKAALTWEMISV